MTFVDEITLYSPELSRPRANWLASPYAITPSVSGGSEIGMALSAYIREQKVLDDGQAEYERWNEQYNDRYRLIYTNRGVKRELSADADPDYAEKFIRADQWLDRFRPENVKKMDERAGQLRRISAVQRQLDRLFEELRDVHKRMVELWPMVEHQRFGSSEEFREYLKLQSRTIELVGRP